VLSAIKILHHRRTRKSMGNRRNAGLV